MTRSLQAALDETNRRRQKQLDYNTAHGITPQTIKKKISDSLSEMTAKDYLDTKPSQVEKIKDIDKTLREYNKKMQDAAANLEFETAIAYRDKIKELEQMYLKS